MAQQESFRWSSETKTNTAPSTLFSNASSEFKMVDSFPSPIAPPQNLPLRVPSLHLGLTKLDSLYNPDDHMNTREEFNDHHISTQQASQAFEAHNLQRMAYVQLSSQRLQAAMGLSNVNTFDLPDLAKLAISPPRIFDGCKSFTITPVTAHGATQETAITSARIVRKRDSGISLRCQTTPVPVGMEVVDKQTGKGLREFMLAKGKEHGMRKREAKEISFWNFATDLKTLTREEEQLLLYDVTKPGDRIDVYETDLPTTSRDLATGSEVVGTETWLWILIQRHDVVTINPFSDTTVPDDHPCPEEDDNPPDSMTPPNFPVPSPSPWMVIAAPLAHLTVYPETIESSASSCDPSARFLKKQRKKFGFNGGRKVHKRIDYDFSHSGVPLFEFSMQYCTDIRLNPCAVPYLSVEGIGTWYSDDPFEKMSLDEWDHLQVEYLEYIRDLAVHDPVMYNKIYDPRLDGTAIVNQGFGVTSPFKGLWWMQYYNVLFGNACLWRNVKTAMARGECRVVVRWSEWEEDKNEDMEAEELLAAALDEDRTLGPVGLPMNVIGVGSAARERHKMRPRSRRTSRLSIDDGTLAAAEEVLAADRAVGVGLGINLGSSGKEKRKRQEES